MKLVVDLGETFANEQSASDAIVQEAARRVLGQRDLTEEVRRRVRQITDDQISAAVKPLIDAALSEGFQPTDSFGSPRGEPTTLRDMVVKEVRYGLEASKQVGYSGRNQQTLLQEIIGREVERVVREDLKQAMDEARKQVRAAVEQKGAEMLAQTIERMAR
jgi:hypothetical protein